MKNYPCWRWSADCPEGRVFDTAEDLAAAPGVWVDSPALLVQVVQEPEQDQEVESAPEPPADVTVAGVVTDAPARKRTRKNTDPTVTAAETDALIAQLEEIAQ